MRITEELREYIWQHATNNDELRAIADHIDEAHKHAIAYVDDRDQETMAEHGWVKLPKDADGEYIHIGDSIEIIGGEYGTAVAIELCEDGGWNVSMRPTGWDTPTLFAAESVRHYKPPTVEDVLREFADAWAEWKDGAAMMNPVETYAAKLRLKEDE